MKRNIAPTHTGILFFVCFKKVLVPVPGRLNYNRVGVQALATRTRAAYRYNFTVKPESHESHAAPPKSQAAQHKSHAVPHTQAKASPLFFYDAIVPVLDARIFIPGNISFLYRYLSFNL
jgi:hypothetical protein